MRIVYFGSGAFGLPTLKALVTGHDVAMVVSQPDRPAGRHRALAPTPISHFARSAGLPILKSENVNEPGNVAAIRSANADAMIVIAFGQKLGPELRRNTFAINLHASLLPKYRGAAPINWAIINGESTTGLSVIMVADQMDAGDILGQVVTPIDPMETAGELHDRLAELGPELLLQVLHLHETGRAKLQPQAETLVTRAPKLSKSEGTVSFDQSAERVRNRVHGLTPWPGCRVLIDGRELRLHRVQMVNSTERINAPAGTIVGGDLVTCAPGSIRPLAVQPPGGKLMSFAAFRAGHSMAEGARMTPLEHAS